MRYLEKMGDFFLEFVRNLKNLVEFLRKLKNEKIEDNF